MSSHQVNRTNVQGLRGLLAGALGAVFLAALSGSGPVWSAPPAPVQYVDLYAGLDTKLKAIDGGGTARPPGGSRGPCFRARRGEPYYAGLTWERYRREKRQMAETIIREIRPDYLTVQNEPGTQAHNTGLPMTVQNVTDLLEE